VYVVIGISICAGAGFTLRALINGVDDKERLERRVEMCRNVLNGKDVVLKRSASFHMILVDAVNNSPQSFTDEEVEILKQFETVVRLPSGK
jgi:hypothetical protein